MENLNLVERHPLRFSLLLLLVLIVVQGVGVGAAQQMGLPANSFGTYTELLLTAILVIIVSRLHWWQEIGFRRPRNWANLLLYLPALALLLGNLTFGIAVRPWPALLSLALFGLLSGFVEEVVFRGLMLRAFLPGGTWKAVLVTTALFGVTHGLNVLAGYEPLYAAVQIGYALAIGFGFAAMVVKGRLLWPLVIAHGLANFVAFINDGEIGTQFFVISLLYIVLFSGYGLYLMLRAEDLPGLPVVES